MTTMELCFTDNQVESICKNKNDTLYHANRYFKLWLNPTMSRIFLLLHEFKTEPRTRVNKKDIL